MKDNQAKYPQLRFKGFTDPWEQRKLGEHSKFRRGSFPQPYGNKEWYGGEGSMPFVQVVDVTNNLNLVEDTKQKISKLAQPKSIFVPKGKVVVTLQGSIGRVAITQYDSYLDRTLLIFEDYTKSTDKYFWAYTIQQKFEIEKQKAPGGTIKTITKEALASFEVYIPEYKEQQKIGSLFKQLDATIALHQRKLDKLKELKQGYLQKLFPENGSKFPQLRFAGFSDAWKQRKLGEVSSSYSGGTPSAGKKSYYGGNIPFIRSAEINNDKTELFLTDAGLHSSSAKMVEIGDILYALYGATSGEVSISHINGAINQAILSIKPYKNYDSQFIMQWLRFQKRKIIEKYLQGGQGNLSGSIVKNLQVDFPIYEEQQKIGTFLQQLDNLITLHQRKLEKLQELKKGYLQKMFC